MRRSTSSGGLSETNRAIWPLLQHLGLVDLTTVTGSGSTVTRVNWVWDELVVACDLVARNGWKSLAEGRPPRLCAVGNLAATT